MKINGLKCRELLQYYVLFNNMRRECYMAVVERDGTTTSRLKGNGSPSITPGRVCYVERQKDQE